MMADKIVALLVMVVSLQIIYMKINIFFREDKYFFACK